MKTKIITYASILAITTIGYATSPDLGRNYQLIQDDRIESNITLNDLTGAIVVDKYGEEVALIYDFEIDPSSGEISTAYLVVGGVMGIGSQYVTLPYSELSYDKTKARFSVKTTHSEIKANIDQQNRKMEMHEKARDPLDHHDADDVENKLVTMWGKVKTSLGVEDEDLAEVEAEVRGNKIYLEGEVTSYELKKKIGEAFQSSSELRVVNEIEVEE
jgi:sporulation protein YlmC with PRC-barrel domain